jgi:phosphatidylethanolamine/phosphatidyl-N-methylethanolamine N-methyltransferase
MQEATGSSRTFFLAWIRDPRRIAAIAPSSPWLAAAMTASIAPTCAPVIELGPGTGVFTDALLERGVPEHRLALVELGDEFLDALRTRYPRATLVRQDASRLGSIQFFGGELAGAVVSGLPLLSMPPARVRRVLRTPSCGCVRTALSTSSPAASAARCRPACSSGSA